MYLGCIVCMLEDEAGADIRKALGILGVALIVAPFMGNLAALSPIIVAMVAGLLQFPTLLGAYKMWVGLGLFSVAMGLYAMYNK
jgi:hypothetical protein